MLPLTLCVNMRHYMLMLK